MHMKTQDLNERFLLAFYINNILIINDMRSKGFKAKFMMAFWGLFVEAHYIAANNDTMEGSQGILPFIILLIVSIVSKIIFRSKNIVRPISQLVEKQMNYS